MLPRLSAPVSGVDSPVRGSTPTSLLLASLLSSCQLSAACLFAVQPPTALCWVASSTPLVRVSRQLPLSRPLPTSGYGEISCPRILCLVSRQNRQLNRLLWQPNHIVLHICQFHFPVFFYFFCSVTWSDILYFLHNLLFKYMGGYR